MKYFFINGEGSFLIYYFFIILEPRSHRTRSLHLHIGFPPKRLLLLGLFSFCQVPPGLSQAGGRTGCTLQVLPQECISPCNAVIITMPETALTRDLQNNQMDRFLNISTGWKSQTFACCHFKVCSELGKKTQFLSRWYKELLLQQERRTKNCHSDREHKGRCKKSTCLVD